MYRTGFYGFLALIILAIAGCAERVRPIGCWQDQYDGVYRFKPQGVVTRRSAERQRLRGTWEMLDDEKFVIRFPEHTPETHTIIELNKQSMTLKFNGLTEFTWPKTSCL